MGEISIDPKFNIHETYKKVRILNPYRNSSSPSGGGYLLDTYDSVLAYSTLKLKTGSNSPLRVENTVSENLELLFTGDSYSLASLVSDGRTLDQFRNGDAASVYSWIDQTGKGNDVQGITGKKPTVVRSTNVFSEMNGNPSLSFYDSLMEIPAISELDAGNAFTIYSVCSIFSSIGTIMSTTVNGDRLVQFADTRTDKRNIFIITDSVYAADMSQVRSDLNTPVLRVGSSSGTAISSWDNMANGDQNIGFSGTYSNDKLRLGEQLNGITSLIGDLQFFMIRAGEDSDTVRNDISTKINALFNIF